MPGLPWTLEEKQVLGRQYPAHGSKGCLPYLPGRTERGIAIMARALGLKHQHTWRPFELRVLRCHFPAGGAKACARLLPRYRTVGGILSKARALGLKRERPWSDQELCAMRDYYPSGGWRAVVSRLRNRSMNAIHAKAQEMDLRVNRSTSRRRRSRRVEEFLQRQSVGA